jgi:hypothetical protein
MTEVASAQVAVEAQRLDGIQPAIADSTPWNTLKESVGKTVSISRFILVEGMPLPVGQDEDSAALITGKLLSVLGPDRHYSYARVCVSTGVSASGQEFRTTLPYSTAFALYDEYTPGGVAVEAYSVKLAPEKNVFTRTWLNLLNLVKLNSFRNK